MREPLFDSSLKWDYYSPMKNHIDLHVRLPRDLHREIWRLADLHGYSLNTEFIVILRKYIDAEREAEAVNSKKP